MKGLCSAEIAQIVSVAAVDGVAVSVGVHGRGGAVAGVLAGALLHDGLGRAWTQAKKKHQEIWDFRFHYHLDHLNHPCILELPRVSTTVMHMSTGA